MAGTYKLIGSVTVGAGGQAAIEFTNIPATYTDLVVKLSGRSSRSAAVAEEFLLTFNNNGSSYSERWLRGTGVGVGSSAFSGSSIQQIGQTGAAATANTFASWDIYIPNYAGSNYKSLSLDGVTESNATGAGDALAYLEAGLWANTAAITSIKISAGSYLAVQHSTAYLYGIEIPAQQTTPKATGGDITFNDTHIIHTFRQSGTFTPLQSLTADYLVVAGGGGGGRYKAGGGGAGGLRSTVTATGGGGSLESALSLTANTAYTVTVGAGGAGGIDAGQPACDGTNGSNSVFSTITSTGGGGGSGGYGSPPFNNGATGGSGGGGFAETNQTGGSFTANQGFAGQTGSSTATQYGGGGGGAGETGGTDGNGEGGDGVAVSISGSSVTYAGGGGGGSNFATAKSGGSGGGGTGGQLTGATQTAGTANTGGGGGGGAGDASSDYTGRAGGSGVVIVRYLK